MAIDEAEQPESGDISGGEDSDEQAEVETEQQDDSVVVGRYTWADFMDDYGHGNEVSGLYPEGRPPPADAADVGLSSSEDDRRTPSGTDWNRVDFDPEEYLGYHPDDVRERITEHAGANGKWLQAEFDEFADPETTPVVKDVWMWEHFKREYYYGADGSRPTKGGDPVAFDETEYLSFEEEETEGVLAQGAAFAEELSEVVDERTVDVVESVDEDDFFTDEFGNTTVTNRYDLEKAVPMEKKTHFQEEDRYWVNKPYAFVVLFHSRKENEKKYYAVEPYLNDIEADLREFLIGKLRTAIKYADDDVAAGADSTEDERRAVIERETKRLLKRYDLLEGASDATGEGGNSFLENILDMLGEDEAEIEEEQALDDPGQLAGIEARPEPVVIAEDPETLSEYQIEKLLYLLKRDFIGYERIDPIKHDINVEDISCDGYNSPVFVYHTDYEQIISNVYHGESELDDFVVKLAQRSGKGISKRRPQVDATLPDGSRAQLTLGREVSDHGTNYTIRQFKDVPFTPIDLINWKTFSLEEMAFLWLCIENHKSLIFAGGTASGKTTSLNAVSLFIPSNTKIVSIEDTREVELPQRNWIASVTRPSFSDDAQGDVDEFDLLEAALRQRPDYIVMGEIRGEEGRTLFQVMSTGHTTYTTFHADSVGEVLKRFTTDPINVSKTMFTALDLVSIQTQTRVHGHKVRRNKELTEVNHYDAENDEINVQDVYQWQAETDEFLKLGDSSTLEEIKFDRGWDDERLEEEIFKREVILAYLIKNNLNEYREVAATIQAFINDPDTILTLIANGKLEDSLEDLREMESVLIDVDPAKEELVPRPDPPDEGYNLATNIIEEADQTLFEDYRGESADGLESALGGTGEADVGLDGEMDGDGLDGLDGEFTFGSDSSPFDIDDGGDATATASEADGDPFGEDDAWVEDDDATDDMWAEARAALEDDVAATDELPEGDDGDDLDADPEHIAEDADLDSDDGPAELDGESADGPAELDGETADGPAELEGETDGDTPTPPELGSGEDASADDGDATVDAADQSDAVTADATGDEPSADGTTDGPFESSEDDQPFSSAADEAEVVADATSDDADEGPFGSAAESEEQAAGVESEDRNAGVEDDASASDDSASTTTDGDPFGDASTEQSDTPDDDEDDGVGWTDSDTPDDDESDSDGVLDEGADGEVPDDDAGNGLPDGDTGGDVLDDDAGDDVLDDDAGGDASAGDDADSPFGDAASGPFSDDPEDEDDEPFWSDDDGGPFSEGGPFSDDGPFADDDDEDEE